MKAIVATSFHIFHYKYNGLIGYTLLQVKDEQFLYYIAPVPELSNYPSHADVIKELKEEYAGPYDRALTMHYNEVISCRL